MKRTSHETDSHGNDLTIIRIFICCYQIYEFSRNAYLHMLIKLNTELIKLSTYFATNKNVINGRYKNF